MFYDLLCFMFSYLFYVLCFTICYLPGKSFELKFIPNQSDLFQFIAKSISELIQTYSSRSEKKFNLI